MAWFARNFFPSSLGHLIPAALLARWNGEDDQHSIDVTEDALIYDPVTGRYKLRKDIFDKLLSDAAQSVWLGERG